MDLDLTAVLTSPLVKGTGIILLIGAIAWVLTEALTSWLPEKYRPAIAVLIGVGFGWLTFRADLIDFGAGPNAWLAAQVFGGIGGAVAPAAHPYLKDVPPFKWLTRITPSGRAATAASTQGEPEVKP